MGKKILTLETLLSKEIEYMLEKEAYKDKQKLPSERELAAYFGVQRLTIRRALQMLVQKGVLVAKERSGYYVAPRRIQITLNKCGSIREVIQKMGKTSTTRLLEFEKIKLTEKLAAKTLLPEGTEVFQILRLRFENKNPIALEKSYIVCELARELTAEDVQSKSLYETLARKCNLTITHSNQKVSIVYANALEAELLKVSLSKPLMKYQGLVYDRKERMTEYFENIMLIERVEFMSTRR